MAGQRRQRDGVLFGVVAAVSLLAALDLIHLHLLSGQPLSMHSSTPLLWGAIALWSWSLGSVLVPVVAALGTTVTSLGTWLQRRRRLRTRPRLAAAIAVSILCSPPIVVVSWALFQGQGIARHPAIASIGPFLGAPVLFVVVTLFWLLREWIKNRGVTARRIAWIPVLGVLAGLFLADARLFVGLYDYLHLTLSLVALWVGIAMARALHPEWSGPGPSVRRRRLRLLGIGVAGSALGLAALVVLLRAAPEGRSDLIERSLYTSRGISLLSPILPLGSTPSLATEDISFDALEATYLEGLSRPSTPPDQRPDILLFSIDAVNADRFPGRGYNPEVMPNIGALLPTATRFDRAYTTIPETQYAVPSLIMSTTRDVGPDGTVRDLEDTIAAALRPVGYGTYWVYEARDLFQGGGVLNNLDFGGFDGRYGIDEERAFASSERIIEILDAQQDRPLFIWTHIFAPHAPYTPPRQFRLFGNSRSGLYDGELHAADAYVGRVIDYLRERGRLDNTIIIITADHGEWSGEEGRFGHGADVKERTVNIPLLFLGPGIEQGVVVEHPVSIVDIGPTIAELAGAAVPESFEGTSLVPALRGEPLDRGIVVTFTEGHGSTAAILDDYKLVFNRNKTVVRLYNLDHDRAEQHDLATAQPERVRELLAQVAALDLERTVRDRVRSDGTDGAIEHYRDVVLDESAQEAERTLAARALGWIDAPQRTQAIVELLARGETPTLGPSVRQWLAHSLAHAGAGDQAEAAWTLAADDHDLMVRVLALRSLRATPRATAAIEAWAGDANVHVRRAAASLLAGQGARARPDSTVSERLLSDEDDLVRALAVDNLERLRVGDRDAAIRRALGDTSLEVRLAAAERCGRAPAGCLSAVLERISHTDDIGERLSMLNAVTPALDRSPARWTELLDGPPAQRALAYAGLGKTSGDFDQLLLERLDRERDDRARAALIRAAGDRRLKAARTALIRQHGEANFSLGKAATEALFKIGLDGEDVPALLAVFPRATQMQTKVNLLHLFGSIPEIDDPRVYDLAERMRATPMKDHHLMRALVEVYSRLTDPRAERFHVDHVMYTNFGYQFWLYGYSIHPEHPRAGDEIDLKMLWSIRWNQPRNAMNFIHILGGPKQIPIDRSTVAGRPVQQWPRCKIMVDELSIQLPEKARRVRLLTGWTRGRRLNIIYGEHDGQNRAVITSLDLEH